MYLNCKVHIPVRFMSMWKVYRRGTKLWEYCKRSKHILLIENLQRKEKQKVPKNHASGINCIVMTVISLFHTKCNGSHIISDDV